LFISSSTNLVWKGMKKHDGCYRWTYAAIDGRFVILVTFACLPQAWATDSNTAVGQGAELTKYLHTHHLPLVSAQLLAKPDGARQLVLYGFTATDFGKQDAVTKSRRFLNDSAIAISNQIKVRPELGSQRPASGSLPSDTGAGISGEYSDKGGVSPEDSSQPANPDAANLQNQSQRDLQSYAAQQQQQQQAYRQQPGMGGMGGGSGLTFGSGGMGMGGGSLGALLGLLGGVGGSRSYGSGSSGYGSPGYGSSGYGSPGYGSSGYGSPSYGAPGYPSAGNPYSGDPYSGDPSNGAYPSGSVPPQP
jgi:hypothetical protein